MHLTKPMLSCLYFYTVLRSNKYCCIIYLASLSGVSLLLHPIIIIIIYLNKIYHLKPLCTSFVSDQTDLLANLFPTKKNQTAHLRQIGNADEFRELIHRVEKM